MATTAGELLLFDGRPFDRESAREAGLLRDHVTALLVGGRIRQPVRGVYLDARVPDDLTSRAACLRLRLPEGAAVCRLTAAWLLGVDGLMPEERCAAPVVECVVPPGRQPPRRPGVRAYVGQLEHAVAEVCGVPATTPARTAVDVLRWLQPHMGLGICDALARRGLVTREEILALVEEFAGFRGVVCARYLADLVDAKSESFGESFLRLRIADAGFPRPTAQIEVTDGTGRVVARLDLGWKDRLVAVEYDGEQFHSSPEQRAHDERRRDMLEREYGWRILAVGRGEVLGRSLALERGIGELLSMAPAINRRRW
jgi:hypothetical protein